MGSLWVTSNPVFQHWALCSAILGLKVLSMAFFAARHEVARNVAAPVVALAMMFANSEGAVARKTAAIVNEDVERVRRAYLNDLENITVFWILGFLFVLTEPSRLSAVICFYGFTVARVSYTVCYLNELMPYRSISFTVGQAINVFLAGSVIDKFLYSK